MSSQTNLRGVVHGKTVELTDDPGMEDGQLVEVILRVAKGGSPTEGLRRSAGALADTWSEEDDQILDQIQQDRRRSNGRELPR
jgi:hypothetical protein